MLYIGENPSIVNSNMLPWLGNVEDDLSKVRHYETCRLCEREPHSDLHILMECTAHPKVVKLRQTFLEGCPELADLLSQVQGPEELLGELRSRPRGELRRSLLPLVWAIKQVYDGLPEDGRTFVTPDKEQPASVLFLKRDSTTSRSEEV